MRFSLLNTLWPRGESLWGHGVITHVDVHIRSASGSRSLEMCIQIRDWGSDYVPVWDVGEIAILMLVLEKTPQTRHGPFWMSAEILS